MAGSDPNPEATIGPIPRLADAGPVLVRGPALSGKYDLLLRLLATSPGRALLISTNRRAAAAREAFDAHAESTKLAVVDCATLVQGDSGDDDPLVRYAASPKNLTGIGVKFTALVDELAGADVAVGLHSLSELVMYSDVEQVFQFLSILLAECRDLGWPVVAVIDDSAIDDQVVATLAQPFETVVSTRLADDQGREFAVTSGDSDPTWTAF